MKHYIGGIENFKFTTTNKLYKFQLFKSEGIAYDLTNKSVFLVFGTDKLKMLLEKEMTITDPTNGLIEMMLNDDDYKQLVAGTLYFEFRIDYENGLRDIIPQSTYGKVTCLKNLRYNN